MIYIIAFTLLHLIKGGILSRTPLPVNKPFFKRVFDGRILSSLLTIPLCIIAGFPEWQAVFFAVAWFLAMTPSLGEEIGAIGGIKGYWLKAVARLVDEVPEPKGNILYRPGTSEDYLIVTRRGGFNKGLQRGIFTGALLCLATVNPFFIVAGALFPLAVWVGVSIGQLIEKKIDSVLGWTIYEGIFGAIIGTAFLMGIIL